jgi:hypothetical protein
MMTGKRYRTLCTRKTHCTKASKTPSHVVHTDSHVDRSSVLYVKVYFQNQNHSISHYMKI